MKKLIVFTALFVLLTSAMVFKGDYFKVEINELVLKHNVNNAANASAMLINPEAYGDGYIVFSDRDIKEHLEKTLANRCTGYEVHLFDSTEKHRIINQDGYVKEDKIEYPCEFIDSQGLKSEINEPTVIIEASLEDDYYRMAELKGYKKEVVRSTKVVVKDRKI